MSIVSTFSRAPVTLKKPEFNLKRGLLAARASLGGAVCTISDDGEVGA